MKFTHKFKAHPIEYDNIRFSSKKEQKRYLQLRLLQSQGVIVFFLRQVPFHLTGQVKYVCDFLVFWADGSATFEDVKGFKTPMYILKKKQVEELYPIKIQEV